VPNPIATAAGTGHVLGMKLAEQAEQIGDRSARPSRNHGHFTPLHYLRHVVGKAKRCSAGDTSDCVLSGLFEISRSNYAQVGRVSWPILGAR
jgi:hypothetical protein